MSFRGNAPAGLRAGRGACEGGLGVLACALLGVLAGPPLARAGNAQVERRVEDGEVVIIEGEAPVAPGTATGRVVDAEAIATTVKRGADDLLRLVPGLHISRHGAEGKAPQIFLRGFDAVHGSDVEVRVAGIPINEMSNVHGHGYVDIGFVIPEVARALHGRKGSFELDQGNFATAGSVDFELGVSGRERGARVGYEVGSTNRHRVLGVVAPEDHAEASFAAIEAVTDQGFGENRGAQRASGLGQLRIDLDEGRFLELMAGAYAARFDEPGTVPVDTLESGEIDFYDTVVDGGAGTSYRALAGLRLRHERDRGRLDVRAHAGWRALALDENFTGYLLEPEMGDRRAQHHASRSAGLRVRYERDLWPALTLVAGGGALGDRIEQSEDQLDAGGAVWMPGPGLSALQLAGALLAGARLRAGGRFRAEAGARLDAAYIAARDLRGDAGLASELMATVSPRLTAAYALSPGWTVFGAYGRGLRSPEARAVLGVRAADMDARASGDAARITTSDAVELGARAGLGERLWLGAGAFGTWLGNEVVFDHLAGISQARQPSRRLGLELDVTYRPLDWLTVRGDASAVDARFTGTGAPVPGVPRFLGVLAASATHPQGWYGGAQLRYLAPRPLAHGARGSAASVLDIGGGLRLDRYALALQIDNVLNTRWREGEYHYASWFDRDQPRSLLPRLHYTAGHPFGVRASLTAWF